MLNVVYEQYDISLSIVNGVYEQDDISLVVVDIVDEQDDISLVADVVNDNKVLVENEDKQNEDAHQMEENDLRNSFIKKIDSLIEQRNRLQEMKFEEVVLKKLEADLKSSTERNTAAQFSSQVFCRYG